MYPAFSAASTLPLSLEHCEAPSRAEVITQLVGARSQRKNQSPHRLHVIGDRHQVFENLALVSRVRLCIVSAVHHLRDVEAQSNPPVVNCIAQILQRLVMALFQADLLRESCVQV